MNKWGYYYQKSEHSYHTFDELDNNLRRIPDKETQTKIMKYLIMKRKNEEKIVKKSEKVCPICHMIKSLTGECLC